MDCIIPAGLSEQNVKYFEMQEFLPAKFLLAVPVVNERKQSRHSQKRNDRKQASTLHVLIHMAF